MNLNYFIEKGDVKRIQIDNIRAKSLIKSSEQTLKSALSIEFNDITIKTIFRELYEGLREYCEAIGFLKGYKFLNHESITYFLDEILSEKDISIKFDRYRKLRNGINYYGNDIEKDTVEGALKEIPKLIKELNKYAIII
ncbi:hypothetical protein J4218_00610 [Candidatus Pacearchaeota archaeon]|nr:hypothetical protein [Candidatus Pacearchaeota archaeon]